MKLSAFQEALNSIQQAKKNIKAQTSGVQQKVVGYSIADFQKGLQNFINNFTDNPVPKDRKQPTATPIASLDDGGILYSDGTARTPGYTLTSPAEQTQLNTLRQNLLQQIPYTPQAVEAINNARLFASGQNGPMSAFNNNSGGFADPYAIHINRNSLSYNNKKPNFGNYGTETLAHEILHYLDDNLGINSSTESNLPGNTSHKFYSQLQKYVPKEARKLRNILSENPELYNKNNRDTLNKESYAYYGSRGPNVFLEDNPEVYSAYSQVYQPMSKNLIASPKYPTSETLNRTRNMLPTNTLDISQGVWEN